MVGWIVKGSEIAKEAGQFHVFFVLFSSIFLGSPEAILKALFLEPESIILNRFSKSKISILGSNSSLPSTLFHKPGGFPERDRQTDRHKTDYTVANIAFCGQGIGRGKRKGRETGEL